MKFDDKYPNTMPMTHIEFRSDEFIKAKEKRPCWHCKDLTYWHNISFGTSLCSEECYWSKNKEFNDACDSGVISK